MEFAVPSLNLPRSAAYVYVYVGPPNCRAEMYALAASNSAPGESRWVCQRDRQTDKQTDRYITLSARHSQRNKEWDETRRELADICSRAGLASWDRTEPRTL